MDELTQTDPVILTSVEQAKPADFTKIDIRPFVILVITDHQGEVLGVLSGESFPLAKLLKEVADDAKETLVIKKLDSLTPLGQDIYTVSRQFLLGLKSVMWNWEGIQELEKTLPLECRCTFVVNF